MRRGFVAMVFLVVAGCSSRESGGTVSGMVLLEGEPVRGGTVLFVDASGKEVPSPISPEGIYEVRGVAVGEARILVRPPSGGRPFLAPGRPGDTGTGPALVAKIAPRYASAESSGLTFKVSRGEQKHNLLLTP